MSKSPRSLRYASQTDMPAGMQRLVQRQAPGYRPGAAAAAREPKRSKYGATPTSVDGIRFDSKREAAYYQKLKARVAAGEVQYFLRQTPLHLPGGTKLVVDFVEFLADGRVRYVDVKGHETQTFRVKKREVEHHYPVRIELA